MYPRTDIETEMIKAAAVDLYRALKAVYNVIEADDALSDRFIDLGIMMQVESALNKAIGT